LGQSLVKPWRVYDPNGKECKYRPIWVMNARGENLAYIGKNADALKLAKLIVKVVNGSDKL